MRQEVIAAQRGEEHGGPVVLNSTDPCLKGDWMVLQLFHVHNPLIVSQSVTVNLDAYVARGMLVTQTRAILAHKRLCRAFKDRLGL